MEAKKFLLMKLQNCILLIEKTIGKDNKLYQQLFSYQDNIKGLLDYADLVAKNSVIVNGEYSFPIERINEIMIHINIQASEEFTLKLKAYLDLFSNVICKTVLEE